MSFFCTPAVADVLALVTVPYITSKRVCPSYNLSSKLAVPLPGKYCARHSMLKMRLGAVPLIEVNMPAGLLTKYRSSQYGKIV